MSSDLGGKPDSEKKSEVYNMPKSEVSKDTDIKENVNTDSIMPDSDLEKSKSLPEPIRVGKDMPARLPPINLAELTSILQGPNMPSQKLMKEVTDKLKMKNDESGSDDGSVASTGTVGMRGIFDCILEASLLHQDSEEESDGENDEIFVRELPCQFCKKIFGSTMNLKTHVLISHSQEDPSVLNVRNQSRDINRKELSPGLRSRSTEAREKEISVRCHKRSAASQHHESSISKEETTLKELKQVRSRHNSKEQCLKEGSRLEAEKKSLDSCVQAAAAAGGSVKNVSISSLKTKQSPQEEAIDEKCDLITSVSETTEQISHKIPEDASSSSSSSSSKATKRKSPRFSSSGLETPSSSKKPKRSQKKSEDGKESSSAPQRRSTRKK